MKNFTALLNRKFCFYVHKWLPVVPILAKWIISTYFHRISWKSNIILPSHLRLCLPSCSFHSYGTPRITKWGTGRVPQLHHRRSVTERRHIPICLYLKSIAQCDGRSIDRRLRRAPSPVGAVTFLTPSAASPDHSACTPSRHLGPPRECCHPFRLSGLCISKVIFSTKCRSFHNMP